MKTLRALLMTVALLAIFLPGCAGPYVKTVKLDRPEEIQGIPCQGKVYFHKNGAVGRCRLSRDFTICGQFLPAKTLVIMTPERKLYFCYLSREAVVCSQPFPAGAIIYFKPEGYLNWCLLPHDWMVQGHLCKGHGSWGSQTVFHPNGTLKFTYLARSEEIQGVPCAANSIFSSATTFHDNGKVASCKLAREISIEGQVGTCQ